MDIAPSSSAPGAFRSAPSETAPRTRDRRRALARNVRRLLLALVVVGALVLAALALRPRPVPVDVARVTRGPLVVAIEESGMTRVKDRYIVSAPVSGTMARISLEPGDPVKEGDALAQIAPVASPLLDERSHGQAEARLGAALSALRQAQAHMARAEAARLLSAKELARVRKLAETGAVSAQSLEQAEFEDRMRAEELASTVFGGKVAAEDVRIARVALGRGERLGQERHADAVSPVSGTVLRVHQKSAGVVQAGAPLVEVGDPAALEVVVDLLTTDAVHVRSGTPAAIQGWGGELPFAGRVRRIEPSAFTRPSALGVDEQRVNVIIVLTEPRDRWAALGDGYRVEARLVLWQAEDVVKAPQGAVFRQGDGWGAFRVEGNIARFTSLDIGHRGETEVEIRSGLAPGATVSVHPGDRVKEGVRVEAR
jgi:HlyD family secretion protein